MRLMSVLFALLALLGVLATLVIAAFVVTPLEAGSVGSGEWGWVVVSGAVTVTAAAMAVSLWRQSG
jgi:hypothetical protein